MYTSIYSCVCNTSVKSCVCVCIPVSADVYLYSGVSQRSNARSPWHGSRCRNHCVSSLLWHQGLRHLHGHPCLQTLKLKRTPQSSSETTFTVLKAYSWENITEQNRISVRWWANTPQNTAWWKCQPRVLAPLSRRAWRLAGSGCDLARLAHPHGPNLCKLLLKHCEEDAGLKPAGEVAAPRTCCFSEATGPDTSASTALAAEQLQKIYYSVSNDPWWRK